MFFPNAKIIFALSTSVIEKNAPVGYVRYNKEIEQYNAAAKELMNRLDVTVNDLYSITQTFDQSCYSMRNADLRSRRGKDLRFLGGMQRLGTQMLLGGGKQRDDRNSTA